MRTIIFASLYLLALLYDLCFLFFFVLDRYIKCLQVLLWVEGKAVPVRLPRRGGGEDKNPEKYDRHHMGYAQ